MRIPRWDRDRSHAGRDGGGHGDDDRATSTIRRDPATGDVTLACGGATVRVSGAAGAPLTFDAPLVLDRRSVQELVTALLLGLRELDLRDGDEPTTGAVVEGHADRRPS